MSQITDTLERIATGIEGLPTALSAALKGTAGGGNVPSLPGSSGGKGQQWFGHTGVGRIGARALNAATSGDEEDNRPGGFGQSKKRGQKYFGHTGLGRIAARGLNTISEQWNKFKTGETGVKEADDPSLGGKRGGLQPKTAEGGANGQAELMKLLTDIGRNIEKMARQAGKYGGQGASHTQLAPSGRQTQMGSGEGLMGGAQRTTLGSGRLQDIHGQAMSAPSTKLNIRARGAGGAGANAKVDMATKIAGIFGL